MNECLENLENPLTFLLANKSCRTKAKVPGAEDTAAALLVPAACLAAGRHAATARTCVHPLLWHNVWRLSRAPLAHIAFLLVPLLNPAAHAAQSGTPLRLS